MRDEVGKSSQQSDGGGAVHPSPALWRQSGIRTSSPGAGWGLTCPGREPGRSTLARGAILHCAKAVSVPSTKPKPFFPKGEARRGRPSSFVSSHRAFFAPFLFVSRSVTSVDGSSGSRLTNHSLFYMVDSRFSSCRGTDSTRRRQVALSPTLVCHRRKPPASLPSVIV